MTHSEMNWRLKQAVRSLSDPPSPPGWNHSELRDILPEHPLRAAAVLVGVVARAAGPTVLLTQRTADLRQHAGQVSFPGGGAEPDDVDVIATALRETREEIGVGAESIRPFGYLDTLDTVSGYNVVPVVADVDAAYIATPDPREVASVFEVPLAFFFDPDNLRRRRVEYRGRARDIIEFNFEQRTIWGATAAMLLSLVRRMEAVK